MADLHVTWEDYHRLIERLALQIHRAGSRANQIVCIARGGLRVGDALSRILGLPLAILAARSYTESRGTVQGKLVIARHLTSVPERLGERVLLVDDMVDSGNTLQVVAQILPQRFSHVEEVRTAVLWYKAHSVYRPDHFVEYLADSPWIHQPFEKYDRMDPQALSAELE